MTDIGISPTNCRDHSDLVSVRIGAKDSGCGAISLSSGHEYSICVKLPYSCYETRITSSMGNRNHFISACPGAGCTVESVDARCS